MKDIKIKVVKEDGINLPEYKTSGSVGLDLRAKEGTTLTPGQVKIIGTGLRIEIPEGYEAQIRTRSGFATKGLFVVNSPGTIDQDYRGEIGVILGNLSNKNFIIKKGDRLAQMVFCPVVKAAFKVVDKLSDTKRGEGGMGSTGVK